VDRALAGIQEKELRISRLEPGEQPLDMFPRKERELVGGLIEIIDVDRRHGYPMR
jgi:hypothetical protein